MSKIHLLHTDDLPAWGKIEMLCGHKMEIDRPIAAAWEDGRICDECLKKHRQTPLTQLLTYAFMGELPRR